MIECNAPDADLVAFSTGATLVKECEHLFPEYKTVPSGENGPGWFTKYDVFFCFGGAKALRVSSDGKVWTMGKGFIPVNGDLRALFLKARTPRRGEQRLPNE
jgi:hypothetical protein